MIHLPKDGTLIRDIEKEKEHSNEGRRNRNQEKHSVCVAIIEKGVEKVMIDILVPFFILPACSK